jgi:hypothetical protein
MTVNRAEYRRIAIGRIGIGRCVAATLVKDGSALRQANMMHGERIEITDVQSESRRKWSAIPGSRLASGHTKSHLSYGHNSTLRRLLEAQMYYLFSACMALTSYSAHALRIAVLLIRLNVWESF